jgi:ABC-type nitrate/sulfonate/bicarbonate transport system ATPase subunit
MCDKKQKILDLINISKSYIPGKSVLENVSFSINKGEIIGIIGENGCGKSTLLRIISGLDKNYSGKIYFKNEVYTSPRHSIILLHQSYEQLFSWLTVEKNVALPIRKVLKIKKAEALNMAHIYLNELGITEKEFKKYPYALSGGQKQRVALARALSIEANIILMDEPFAAIDEKSRKLFQVMLKEISLKKGIAFLIVSHSLDEIKNIADKLIYL